MGRISKDELEAALTSNLESTGCFERTRSAGEFRACEIARRSIFLKEVDSLIQELGKKLDDEGLPFGVPEELGKDYRKKLMLKAHSDWLSYVDSQCKYEGSEAAGGTGYSSIVVACQNRIFEDRLKRLRCENAGDCDK